MTKSTIYDIKICVLVLAAVIGTTCAMGLYIKHCATFVQTRSAQCESRECTDGECTPWKVAPCPADAP